MKEYQSLSHTRWDCKYHDCVHTEAHGRSKCSEYSSAFGELFHDWRRTRSRRSWKGT